jgi:hypothetical protein
VRAAAAARLQRRGLLGVQRGDAEEDRRESGYPDEKSMHSLPPARILSDSDNR